MFWVLQSKVVFGGCTRLSDSDLVLNISITWSASEMHIFNPDPRSLESEIVRSEVAFSILRNDGRHVLELLEARLSSMKESVISISAS